MYTIEDLLEIMASLRDPADGCPWDLGQDFASIAPYTLEEAYEVADAIARQDLAALRGELGDLLFQVVFHARMAEEREAFGFAQVVHGICDKLIRRHPHVFGTEEQRRRGAEAGSWERIKAEERAAVAAGEAPSAMDGVAVALPALARADKLGRRAAGDGFDWPDAAGARAKVDEELEELDAARQSGDRSAVAEELGDLLFALVNLSRHLGLDPEETLRAANSKFESRYRAMEQAAAEAGTPLAGLGLDAMEALWQAAKRAGH
ncbi:MAG: nucleoside triphosphate pyrophosphohydrolase [Gammaproteobacteria bacterium]|nr:nucleoside triphosphate pyrophosphohydrolase [Gammaproteobacteria bacterium]MDH4254852.1 nucleoside triphosphate pyrophosphohydrolase [Gammaproteobacteria bacterium]MDH5310184.1 nucleoside triphosphate pyrophosphohydrolase [Gammaproteobacteria bacterium]